MDAATVSETSVETKITIHPEVLAAARQAARENGQTFTGWLHLTLSKALKLGKLPTPSPGAIKALQRAKTAERQAAQAAVQPQANGRKRK